MNFVADVIVAFAVILAVYLGARRGFVKTVMNFACFTGACLGSYYLSSFVGAYLSKKVLLPAIKNIISSAFTKTMTQTGLASLFSEKPKEFTQLVDRFGNFKDVEKLFNGGKIFSFDELAQVLAAPIAESIGMTIAFIGLFVLIFIVLKLVAKLICGVAQLPILRGVNKMLGSVLGFGQGIVWAWLLSFVIVYALPALSSLYPTLLGGFDVEKTLLLKHLYNFNPLTFLFN